MRPVKTTHLTELARTSYEIAKSKGWWDRPRSFSAITLLMISEVSEALEDYRAHRGLNEMFFEYTVGGNTVTVPEAELLNLPRGVIAKPCGVPSELADVCIRIADYAGSVGFDLEAGYDFTSNWTNPAQYDRHDFELCLGHVSRRISKAFAAWADFRSNQEINFNLAWALHPLFDMADAKGIALDNAIQVKAGFNATRSHRHGNKLI